MLPSTISHLSNSPAEQGAGSLFYLLIFNFYILVTLCGLQDLSSLTRDQTQAPAVKAPSPNHWTTREFPGALSCISEETHF